MAGVQAGSAGRLSIEIVAEIARLQQDLDKAKKLVNAASGDIAKGARAANDNLGSMGDGANRAARGAQRLGDDARKAGTGLDSLSGAATRLAGALAAAFSVREVGRAADAWSDMQSRIGAAIKDMDAAPAVMQEMVRLANASYSSLDQTVETFGRNVGVLKELGLSTNQALQYTEALNHALVITATKGQEAASVQNALSKAMAVGKLQADGLETVLANGGKVAEALAAELGTTINGLREMSTQGKITSEIIANSLINRLDELRAAAEEMPATMEDGFLRIKTNFTALVGQFDQSVGASQKVAEALVYVADNLEPIARYAVAAGTAFVTYRAALMASAALTKTYTVATGALGAVKLALAGSTSVATAATNAFTAAIARNPVGIFAVALASLAATYVVLRKDITGATEATLRMAEINQRATKIENDLRTAMVEVANATGDAKVEALERAEALREQASEAVRAARAEAALAAVTAMRRAQEALDRAELARASVRYNPFVEGDIGFIQQAVNARKEAEKASQAWRESMLTADGLARSIEEAAKPVQLLATNLGNAGKETKKLRDEAKKLDDAIGKLVDGNLKNLSREMAKIFKDADAIGAGIFKASDDELNNVLEGIQERRKFEEWKRLEDQRIAQENRNRALNTAYEIADIIGGSFGDVVAELSNAVIPLLNVSDKLGALLESFGKGAVLGGAIGGVSGSRTGGALGGGIGQVLGEEFLGGALSSISSSLGKFAGPIGAIAGGLLGGIVGGMLKSTPRASATVSIIAGEAMETAIKGSSGKLRKIAGGLADSVITGLSDIADQFGAELMGDAQVSIGMRKKNYRVDPTGRGVTKTSKGAIDFGDDQAAAIAYAIQVAIQQGVIGGLSESLKRLIQGDGDLQSQLQKALSFQSVFDELFQRLDPQGFDLAQLDKWRAGMDKIFAEAGATAEELAKLEELTGLKRAEIVEKYANEIAQAEDDARQIRQLEIEIMRLTGDTLGALAAERALEQEGMSAAVVELMKRRDALVDEAAATQEATRAAEEAAALQRAIADERYSLEARLLDLLGDTAAIRARELEALDPSNRALLERIHALQDEAAAATAAARAAEELAARNKAIADEISGLDRQWLQLIGDVDTLRSLQLGDLLSDGAREKQQMIWDEQDRQAAEEAARRAAEEAARAAEQAAQAYARAIEEHNKAIEAARNTLAQAYERESSALRQTIETFRAFGQEIRAFRQNLFAADNPALGYDQARTQFLNTSRMASLGNEASLQRFTGDAQAFLDMARGRAGSLADYQREAALVAREALKAERGAGGIVTEAQRQIRLMDEQVKGILDLNEKAITFGEALDAYHALQARQMPTFVDTVSSGIEIVADRIEQADARQEKRDVEAAKRDADAVRREETMLIALNRIERLLSRLETDDGLAVSLRGPLPVTGSVDARITNATGSPVPTKEVA